MKLFKRAISVFIILSMMFTMPLATFAESWDEWILSLPKGRLSVDIDPYNTGIPQLPEPTKLNISYWNGQTKLETKTCYFVEGNVVVSGKFKLPKNSMLVVRKNAELTIKGRIYSRGVIAVHKGGKISVVGSDSITNENLYLHKSSITIVNGDFVVLKTGKVKTGGQFVLTGFLSSKGKMDLSYVGTYLDGKIEGKKTSKHNSPPPYIVQEIDTDRTVIASGNYEYKVISKPEDLKILKDLYECSVYKNIGNCVQTSFMPYDSEYNMDVSRRTMYFTYQGFEDSIGIGSAGLFGRAYWNGMIQKIGGISYFYQNMMDGLNNETLRQFEYDNQIFPGWEDWEMD